LLPIEDSGAAEGRRLLLAAAASLDKRAARKQARSTAMEEAAKRASQNHAKWWQGILEAAKANAVRPPDKVALVDGQ